jgi:uncharacterized membrane protein (GlpM family)
LSLLLEDTTTILVPGIVVISYGLYLVVIWYWYSLLSLLTSSLDLHESIEPCDTMKSIGSISIVENPCEITFVPVKECQSQIVVISYGLYLVVIWYWYSLLSLLTSRLDLHESQSTIMSLSITVMPDRHIAPPS